MYTVNHLINNILDISKGGRQSDDDLLTYNQVKLWIDQHRAQLFKEYYMKYREVPTQYYQDLSCVELFCVDEAECCPINTGQIRMKSVLALPSFITFPNGAPFTVNKIDGLEQIPLVDIFKIRWKRYERWTKFLYKAFVNNNHLYIDIPQNMRNIKYVRVRGVLLDPEDQTMFSQCNTSECYDPEKTVYPVPPHLMTIIVQKILDVELRMTISTEQINDRIANTTSP